MIKSKPVNKILKTISSIVLIVASLSLFSASVNHAMRGGKALGPFTKPIQYLTTFPETALEVIREVINVQVLNIPPTYEREDPAFQEVNRLNYDVFALNSFYDAINNLWEIRLFNLRDDSIHHSWSLKENNFNKSERQFANSDPRNSLLLENRSLIATCDETNNLYRLDEASNIVWHNTAKKFHHAMNLAVDDNIWICTSENKFFKINVYAKDKLIKYRDDFITKINSQTGAIMFDKSVSEILIENGYINFVHGLSNDDKYHPRMNFEGYDPIHLNDIEPVFSDGEYWKRGDLFLSLRHVSLVILYRPETNKIVRLFYGPFLNQHDVDIYSNNEISIFNNNITGLREGILSTEKIDILNYQDEFTVSGLTIYNFKDSTYKNFLEDQFFKEKIFTLSEGLHTVLKSGDVYIESQNSGKMYILNEKEVLLKKYFQTPIDGRVERPHWLRIYEDINF